VKEKIVFAALKLVVGLLVSPFLAFALEVRLPFETPGSYFAKFIATHIWEHTGGDLLGHSLQIMFITDTFLCFAIVCCVYFTLLQLRAQFWSAPSEPGRKLESK
jgi:hypothetical protein